MDRKLIEYLPLFVQEYVQMEKIMSAEQPEIEGLWSECNLTLDNFFVQTTQESGIKRWEQMLSITPKATATLTERQFTVLSRLNEQNPFTYRFLENQLKILCGEKGYKIELIPKEYSLHVKVELTAKSKENDVRDLLKRICPANLLLTVSLLYNQHQTLRRFTHQDMNRYTHFDLREEALGDG